MDDSTAVVFEELTKDNYKTWRLKAEALLRVSDLWNYVEENEESLKDAELWMKENKIAKSKLILHISSSLLPLVENCTTTREIWSKLENVYGNKDEQLAASINHEAEADDEDAIINAIEKCVEDFFNIINNSSDKKLLEDQKSLSATFRDNLLSQLKENNVKKSLDEKIIINAVSDFIDVIDQLPNIKIKEQTNELSCELVDIMLVKFDINPHKNDDSIAKSDAVKTEEPNDNVQKEKKSDGIRSQDIPLDTPDIATNESKKTVLKEVMAKDKLETSIEIYNKFLLSNQQVDDERVPHASDDQHEYKNSMHPLTHLYTPPTTPTPKKTYKCGVCRKEGHNRTTCLLNRPVTSVPKFVRITKTPKRSYRCGACGDEGHNRTSCPLNKFVTFASKSPAGAIQTPKISRKCGICRAEGHNRTTCQMNKSAVSASKSSVQTPITPKIYKCGGCGKEGHNITTCPWSKSVPSTPKPAAMSIPARSYMCGLCGGEGHNRSTCSRNSVTSTPSARASPRCSTCGNEGHNSRTCGRRSTSLTSAFIPSYLYTPPSLSYSSPSPSYSGGGRRSYTCGNCGGSGHNRRTCSG
ncbi:uncharacterized protein LOC107217503 [Neodiprion lecontei]|uniref:Uncharacterized protein LOC107217503 n=1 Tax=Neodiprion lecontei TaxID=441921 RepID=A0A6J0BA33_NEOLC|nr:uncharacterized protein LOC107217503 [Neodiprion lecontei]